MLETWKYGAKCGFHCSEWKRQISNINTINVVYYSAGVDSLPCFTLFARCLQSNSFQTETQCNLNWYKLYTGCFSNVCTGHWISNKTQTLYRVFFKC